MKRIVALLVLFVLFLSMVPSAHAYEVPVTSSNIDEHYYVNAGRFNDPITSTLEVTEEGYNRVEYVGDRLIAEKYDRNFRFVSGQEIQLELPIYGGVYLGDDYNFVVVGQLNMEEDDSKEVFRIIRYSKDWVRQASASLYGANTYIPFDAGSLRFARSGDILYIRTSHEMYASSDGLHHQANVMISVRISDMTVTDQLTRVLNKNYGYVSHSFNQFVLVDGNDLLAVDHGDALPRSVVLFKYSAPAGQETFYGRTSYVNALPIVDSTYHYNDTGVSVGGFEASSDHYLIAGSSADQSEACDLMYAHRNIFVTATPKDNFTDDATTIRWLTSFAAEDNVEVSPPHLVKLSADRFFLIWTENGRIRYCTLDGKGALEGEIRSAEGDLSDCVPVLDGNRLIWYVTNFSAPKFYVIEPDASAHEHSYASVVTAPTCTQQGYTTYTCAVCGHSYVSDYTAPVDHVYEDGYCKWCDKGEQYVKWYSGTTSLNGVIELNIYVLLSEDLVKADDTYVRFTYDGQTVDVPMADAVHAPLDKHPNRYRFSCPIYAKQMADNVNVTFMKGSEMIGTELDYSVMRYCVNQIRNCKVPEEVALYKAMLNYGAAAQLLFGHNTGNLANASLSDGDKALPDVDASAYKYSVSGSESGIKAKSATLMLDDVVKVRVYFSLTGDKTIDAFTFTIDGKEVTPSRNEKGWYVETDGIAAKDLEKMFSIRVGGITVTYGALSYVNSKANGSNELEANIAKALFVYWQAAESYLG